MRLTCTVSLHNKVNCWTLKYPSSVIYRCHKCLIWEMILSKCAYRPKTGLRNIFAVYFRQTYDFRHPQEKAHFLCCTDAVCYPDRAVMSCFLWGDWQVPPVSLQVAVFIPGGRALRCGDAGLGEEKLRGSRPGSLVADGWESSFFIPYFSNRHKSDDGDLDLWRAVIFVSLTDCI